MVEVIVPLVFIVFCGLGRYNGEYDDALCFVVCDSGAVNKGLGTGVLTRSVMAEIFVNRKVQGRPWVLLQNNIRN